MNTNVLHRWLKEWTQGFDRLDIEATTVFIAAQAPAFVPLALSAGASPFASDQQPVASPTPASDICIECQRTGMSVTMHWPLSAAGECAQMLRPLLR